MKEILFVLGILIVIALGASSEIAGIVAKMAPLSPALHQTQCGASVRALGL